MTNDLVDILAEASSQTKVRTVRPRNNSDSQQPMFEPLEGRVLLSGTVYDVLPTDSVAAINAVIVAADSGDTINFTEGQYNQGQNQFYTFIGDKNYTLEDGVVVIGFDSGMGKIFQTTGSNINITGNGTVVLKNSQKIGIFAGDNFYEEIYVQGLTSESGGLGTLHYQWNNIRNTIDVTNPSVYFSNMVLSGLTQESIASTGFHFKSLGQDTDGTSPYISVDHVTAEVTDILVDVPIRDDITALSDGQYHITNNAIISGALTMEVFYPLFGSPIRTAQLGDEVTSSHFLKENFDGDPNNDITQLGVADSLGNVVLSDFGFVPGTQVPTAESPLNLGNGEYIGAHQPVPEPATFTVIAIGGIVAILSNNKKYQQPT